MITAMLRWLHRLLRRKPRPAPVAVEVLSLPPAGSRAGRKRITTTAAEFDAHLARRRPP